MTKTYTAKTFQSDLLFCLGELSGFTADRPVAMKDAIDATLERIGLAPDALGSKHSKLETHRLIQLAFRGARGLGVPLTSSPSKGQWALTERGVLKVKPTQGQRKKRVVALPDESKATPEPDLGHVYDADPYIRSLAIAKSPCFSILYDPEHPTCDTCVISKYCRDGFWERCQTRAVHAAIDAELTEAGAFAVPDASGSETEIVTFDEVVLGIVAEPEPIVLTEDQFARASRIKAGAKLVCYKCEKAIKQETHCYFVRPIGSFHLECFRALQGKNRSNNHE